MNRSWIAVGLLAALGAVLAARFFFGPNPHGDAQAARAIATRGLVEAIAAQRAGTRLLVLSNPFVRRTGTSREIIAMEEAGLRGIRAAAVNGISLGAVVYPELRAEAQENPRAVPIDAETTTPLSYLVAPDAFDRAAQEHPECDVIVSLIGLPIELDHCAAWKNAGPPSFALLLPDLRMVGGAGQVVAAVKSGKLAAVVLRKADGVGDHVEADRDFSTEFNRRFLLITKENVETVARDTPELLERGL
jgi:hypothetical protein